MNKKLITLSTAALFVLISLCLSVITYAQDACGCGQTASDAANSALFQTSDCVVGCQAFGGAAGYCEDGCWGWFEVQMAGIIDDYNACACT